MNPIVITATIAVVAFAFVLAPLLRRRASGGEQGRTSARASRAREMAPENPLPDPLEELELDRAMGKLTAGDYDALRAAVSKEGRMPDAKGRGATAQSLGMAGSQTPTAIIDSVEESELDARAEALIRAARISVVSCATCGERPEPGATFCSHCGRGIGGCAVCGAAQTGPKGQFCTQCGAALRA